MLLGLLLRLRGVTNPYLDDQGWRQADTASMAINMLGHLSDFPQVFFPHLNYDGATPQAVELEFPFLPYLLAWTWTFLGWQDLWGRLWAIFFSLLTIWGIYELGKKAFSQGVGLWAAAIYAFLPLTTYYGRVVMPEPVAQAFSIWALVGIFIWRQKPSLPKLFLAAILMAGAILAKLPQLMIFLVALVLGFYPLKGRIVNLLSYTVLSLTGPMLYYTWVHRGAGAARQFVSGILSYQVLESQTNYVHILFSNLEKGMGLSLLLVFAGLICAVGKLKKKPSWNPALYGILLWLGISFIYLVVVCLKIPLDYYLVPVALPFSLLAGYALAQRQGLQRGRINLSLLVGLLILGLLCFNQYWYYETKYNWDEGVLTQAEWIRMYTEEDSVLVLSGPEPMTLYYAQRCGYRLIRSDDQAWEELQTLPGDYLIALPNSRGEVFWQRVNDKFPEVGPGVYKLR